MLSTRSAARTVVDMIGSGGGPGAATNDPTPAVLALDAVLGNLAGSETRDGQRRMCAAVEEAFHRREHLIVQAGTGTGKSLAYLVPAILAGERVVVATVTRALQEQLCRKDLPFLADHMGVPFSFALLKGRSNYLCDARHKEITGDRAGSLAGIRADDDLLDEIDEWVTGTETGDRADLPRTVPDALWERLSVDSRECPGRTRCDLAEACFAEAARDRAAAADVVVVNTALFALDLAAAGAVLPTHALAVVDEAHSLEDVCTSAFGVELGSVRLSRLVAAARGLLAADGEVDPSAALAAWPDRIETLLSSCPSERRLDLDEAALRNPLATLEQVLAELAAAAGAVSPGVETGRRAQARMVRLLDSARADLQTLLRADADRDAIWVEERGRRVLRMAPVDVGPPLADACFSRRTTILTSATLALGGDFSPLAWRLGLRPGLAAVPRGVGDRDPDDDSDYDKSDNGSGDGGVSDGSDPEEQRHVGRGPADPARHSALDVGSPFDYRRQAILYCAKHLPDPRAAEYEEAMLDETEALTRAAGGRMLGLCTSLRAAEAVRAHLRDRLGVRVLGPDDYPRARLMEEFAGDETSCLVGSIGLWQGLDVPGPSVSLVVIDKIPFARPDDPIAMARRERAAVEGRSAFETYDLPRAAMMLAQGAGRLVRTSTDRGVVALMDRRLVSSGYGARLLASLPPMHRLTDGARVRAALERLREVHESAAPGAAG